MYGYYTNYEINDISCEKQKALMKIHKEHLESLHVYINGGKVIESHLADLAKWGFLKEKSENQDISISKEITTEQIKIDYYQEEIQKHENFENELRIKKTQTTRKKWKKRKQFLDRKIDVIKSFFNIKIISKISDFINSIKERGVSEDNLIFCFEQENIMLEPEVQFEDPKGVGEMNNIENVARTMNIGLNEDFVIKNKNGLVFEDVYIFTEKGLRYKYSELSPPSSILEQLIIGNLEIIKKPSFPKEGTQYVFVIPTGELVTNVFSKNSVRDIMNFKIRNFFISEEQITSDEIKRITQILNSTEIIL